MKGTCGKIHAKIPLKRLKILQNFLSIAQTYGTPTYVYDFDKIAQNVADFKSAFNARKSLLCYALKANSNLSLLRHLAQMDCGADCVSINEVKRALLAGIPKYKIIYSGVGKGDSDIKEALEKDILFINVESVGELLRVEAIAESLGKVARISVRVNPNIDAKTHPYISTGLNENKFGVDIESAKKIFIHAKKSPFLEPIAVHFHIGSQLLQLTPIIESARKIVGLIKGLLALKIDIKFIDIGGGLGIAYNGEKTIDLYDYAQGILGELKGLDLTIICELGRRIVGDCGVLLTKVLYEKQNEFKRFCIVDAAMNDLIRPTLYNAKHRVILLRDSYAGNSVLGMQFRTCGNFQASTDSSLVESPKISTNTKATPQSLPLRFCESQNLGENSAESTPDSADSQNLVNLNSCEAPETRPLRGAKNREQGCSSATTDFLLEAEKRGSPPKSEKRSFWRVGGAGRGVQPFCEKESSEVDEKNSVRVAESSLDSANFFKHCDIVGPICESSDYLAKDIALPPTKSGDLLAILDCGAYGFSMSSNYNSRLKCAEVALKNGEDFLIRARESFAESVANEENCLSKNKGKL